MKYSWKKRFNKNKMTAEISNLKSENNIIKQNNLHDYLIVGLLFLINLLNHIDRLIVAG